MSNTNVNNNIAQIVFPKDVEIRKVKKKKRKSNGKKKKAIAELKAILKEFDLAVDSAHQNNIDLPEELGILPTNIEDVNSIKEIEALVQNIHSRIETINSLILAHSHKSRANDLFSEEQPIHSGVFPPLPATPIQPITYTTTDGESSSDLEALLEKMEQSIKQRLSTTDKETQTTSTSNAESSAEKTDSADTLDNAEEFSPQYPMRTRGRRPLQPTRIPSISEPPPQNYPSRDEASSVPSPPAITPTLPSRPPFSPAGARIRPKNETPMERVDRYLNGVATVFNDNVRNALTQLGFSQEAIKMARSKNTSVEKKTYIRNKLASLTGKSSTVSPPNTSASNVGEGIMKYENSPSEKPKPNPKAVFPKTLDEYRKMVIKYRGTSTFVQRPMNQNLLTQSQFSNDEANLGRGIRHNPFIP